MELLAGTKKRKKTAVKKKKKKCQISATISYLVATQQNNGFSTETLEYCGKPQLREELKNRTNKKIAKKGSLL